MSRMRRLVGILSLLLLYEGTAWSGSPVVIHLRDGRQMSGHIVEESADNLLLDTPDQRRWRIPRVLINHTRRLMTAAPEHPPTPAPVATIPAAKEPAAPPPTEPSGAPPSPPVAPQKTPAAESKKADDDQKSPPAKAESKPAPKPVSKPKPVPKKNKAAKGKWTHDIRLGLDLRYTAVTQQTVHSRVTSTYAGKQLRNRLDWSFAYGETANAVSADRMSGLMKSDWTFDSDWYVYHTGSAGYDIVRRIALTYAIGPGLGYHIIRNRRFWFDHSSFSLDLETGGEYEDKLSTTGLNTERYFWRIAQLIRWNISRDLTFTEEFEYFPSVSERVNQRYRAEVNLAYQLIKNLSLNLTVQAEADPQQLNDFVPDDVQIRSSIGWRF